jgi:hypothetical protein
LQWWRWPVLHLPILVMEGTILDIAIIANRVIIIIIIIIGIIADGVWPRRQSERPRLCVIL